MNYKYQSIAVNFFNIWRILFFGTVVLIFGLSFYYNIQTSILFSFITIFIFFALYGIYRYCSIERIADSITIRSWKQSTQLSGIISIQTWWNYEIGASSAELGQGSTNTSRGHSNKINIYAQLNTHDRTYYLYEQIYLSSKFPNNHIYDASKKVPSTNITKVWDIDNCIKALNLQANQDSIYLSS